MKAYNHICYLRLTNSTNLKRTCIYHLSYTIYQLPDYTRTIGARNTLTLISMDMLLVRLQALDQTVKIKQEHLHGHFLFTESMKEKTLLDRVLLILQVVIDYMSLKNAVLLIYIYTYNGLSTTYRAPIVRMRKHFEKKRKRNSVLIGYA
ncbi:uncharacterized protein EV154DRAFT_553127 [Mucor mucedo]|uniref:uncharacterized protein n=1 Tax=Mucor mucedo TaxID=29922 RepID=UPI0022208E0D|nr:uncharacterized protein EV154DRAFT_553127 [Mucor mucedo]KAI7889360.1 hypothetical protein EV154DRAFT_553127 [Mucor mucedo]